MESRPNEAKDALEEIALQESARLATSEEALKVGGQGEENLSAVAQKVAGGVAAGTKKAGNQGLWDRASLVVAAVVCCGSVYWSFGNIIESYFPTKPKRKEVVRSGEGDDQVLPVAAPIGSPEGTAVAAQQFPDDFDPLEHDWGDEGDPDQTSSDKTNSADAASGSPESKPSSETGDSGPAPDTSEAAEPLAQPAAVPSPESETTLVNSDLANVLPIPVPVPATAPQSGAADSKASAVDSGKKPAAKKKVKKATKKKKPAAGGDAAKSSAESNPGMAATDVTEPPLSSKKASTKASKKTKPADSATSSSAGTTP